MKIGNRFFVRALVLAATAGIGAGAVAGPTDAALPCQICLVLYQNCVTHGGGMGECEDQLDQCRITHCSGTAAVMPSDRKGAKASAPAILASASTGTRR